MYAGIRGPLKKTQGYVTEKLAEVKWKPLILLKRGDTFSHTALLQGSYVHGLLSAS